MAKTTKLQKEQTFDYVPKWRNMYNAPLLPSPTRMEDYSKVISLTVPEMAMSVQEILLKHTSGRPLPQLRDHEYHGDLMLPDVRTLDLVEREELRQWAADNVVRIQEEYNAKQKLRREKHAKQQASLTELLRLGKEALAQQGGTTPQAKAPETKA